MRDLEEIIQYLVNPTHVLSIGLVGCGGTGSEVIRHLARMNGSLIELGHPGFHVTASDPDVIGRENIFRQPYTAPEIGLNKAAQLISRVNRSFGTQWKSEYMDWDEPMYYDREYYEDLLKPTHSHNILITCLDSVETRRKIAEAMKHPLRNTGMYRTPMLWIDFGNGKDFGQVIMSIIVDSKDNLANVFDIYPNVMDLPEEPSCSLAVSLGRQDLFINSILSDLGMRMLWNLLRTANLEYNCIFVNLNEQQPVKTALIHKTKKREKLLIKH